MVNPRRRQRSGDDSGKEDSEVPQEDAQEEADINSAELNTLVATYISDYRDEIPQIGKIVNVEGLPNSITIEWLQGTYSSIWKVCKKREGRALVPWVEEIPKTAIISSVKLTKGQRLPGSVRDKLKSLYAPLLQCEQ